MNRLILLLACLEAACVASTETVCPSGRVCPPSTTCRLVAELETCASEDQLAACTGAAALASCDADDPRRVCIDGVCLDPCGNAHVDPGETCDDGNAVSGDGCSPTCQTEVCGNGIVDVADGEQCDDGALGAGDGCSLQCEVELPAWDELTTSVLTARTGCAATYMGSRDRVVVFGGSGPAGFLGDTWLRADGGLWAQIDTTAAPAAREHASLVWDAARDRAVLFGGFGTGGPRRDTWEWDGEAWTERTPAMSPPPRFGTQLAYDAVRMRVVLFGGRDVTGALDDTWEWDGMDWTLRTVTQHPSGFLDVQLAYDPTAQKTILCGSGGSSPGTWSWNGSVWTDLGVACPVADGASRMVFDPRRGQIILVTGGAGETYGWTGADWKSLALSATPVRKEPGLVVDRSGLVLFGGRVPTDAIVGDVWLLESAATGWSGEPTRAATPTPRQDASVATDPDTGVSYLFGGEREGSLSDQLWQWDRRRWSVIAGAMPSVRRGAAMTFDAERGELVLFGGAAPGAVSDTWTFAPSVGSWQARTTNPTPPAREGARMVFDAARGVVVMFGGRGSTGLFSDTWTWNGSTWSKLAPAMSPPARSHHAMVFDPVRARVVLTGGMTGVAQLADDTWEWDGTTWTMATPAASPPPRARATLVFDPLRQRSVLVGGTDAPLAFATFGDAWEWDGATWRAVTEDARVARSGHVSFYDTARRGLAVFAGTESSLAGTSPTAELWMLRYRD